MKKIFSILIFIVFVSFFATGLSYAACKKVGSVTIIVSDLNKAVDFYTKVLCFEKVDEKEVWGEQVEKLEHTFGINRHSAKMKLGEEYVILTDYLTSGGRAIPADARSNDLSFQHIAIVVSDMDSAYARLKKFNVEHVSTLPQTIPATNKAASGVRAFYFHDPDNHTLELISFPPDKGDKRWQEKKSLFLGIDHTAVGISSTEKSLKFYSGILGLQWKGESFNYGTEQEHLNNIQNASLHITGLRAVSGPGIEFLEYIKPGPGKMYPSDSRCDDLISWQTEIVVDSLQKILEKIPVGGETLVSDGIITADGKMSALIRDPDGHLLLLVQYIPVGRETN